MAALHDAVLNARACVLEVIKSRELQVPRHEVRSEEYQVVFAEGELALRVKYGLRKGSYLIVPQWD